jgi:hypothetical protein
VTLNGVAQNDVSGSNLSLEFDGLGGQDTVIVVGNTGKEIAKLSPGQGTVSGEDYLVTVANVESIRVEGGGGTDVACLSGDPSGNDTFKADPDRASLSGNGYSNEVVGFRYVHGYGDVGNDDVALLSGDPSKADTFQSWPHMARLYGTDFYNRVKSFRWVHGYGTPGNKDVAFLYGDPAQNDTFEAWPQMARMRGDDYYNRVKSFRYVHAYATTGNRDVAFLRGDPGAADKFEAWPHMARLYGGDYYNRVKSFRYVHAYGTPGNQDLARLYGSAANDTLYASSYSARLQGSGFNHRAVLFDQIEADGGGGSDTAKLYDAALESGLAHYANVDAILWLSQFDQINQHDTETDEDTSTEAADEIFTAYWQ